MTIGLLIITHGDIGKQMLEAARVTLNNQLPLKCETLSILPDCNPDDTSQQANTLIDTLDSGSGVLVLTDIYGSTPSNIANRCDKRPNIKVVAGINLPMLFRILNYAHLELNKVVDKALSGGHDGIFLCEK